MMNWSPVAAGGERAICGNIAQSQRGTCADPMCRLMTATRR